MGQIGLHSMHLDHMLHSYRHLAKRFLAELAVERSLLGVSAVVVLQIPDLSEDSLAGAHATFISLLGPIGLRI